MKASNLFELFAFLVTLAVSCAGGGEYADSGMWFSDGSVTDAGKPDVFYIVSTDVLGSRDADGKVCYNAVLSDSEREALTAEMMYARGMFGDSVNFFSPYYHQFTLEALDLDSTAFESAFASVVKETGEAFGYYMKHLNGGRPYILAGFSQGAMAVRELLLGMDESEYSSLVAAYLMGYKVMEGDLNSPCIVPAATSSDTGVIVTFNSVSDTTAVWPFVSDGAAACINPVNWCTDATPADFVFEGDSLSVKVDTARNVLLVDGLEPGRYSFPVMDAFCPPGNLHHWDLLFYKDAIRRNALERFRAFKSSPR